ncbi:hypothetical protein PPSIR1_37544 [Plesiocystis pacifica SIR-1]|uniref:DUF2330 domain-containing protein n=1 Tax=Plesiocystis pacifica SIR-1 TaxID=391625 RepID=A6GB34_9BACT|nr:DUF2330 domain-containing protein [Plesiocystis pacifica]EDM76916.1 hypothetical protein PPSIR1_37544 [Plesiocystis pacifica SIR-1]
MMASHSSSPRALALSVVGACLLGGLGVLAPSAAQACGGTFCDQGPQVMPVDQTGETILFWLDESQAEPFTEAHIQIAYEGDAERFAWIVPVMAAPEVLVSSQRLFDNLLNATVPTFTLQFQTSDCIGDDSVSLCGGVSSFEGDFIGDTGFSSFGDDEVGGEEGGGGIEIIDRGLAGAFEYVVLTGSTVDEVVDWLDEAGYAQDEDAPPILQEYLDEDFLFVALKLQSGAGVDEIHPLAIRYPGTEPCIPIRLTRIAAVEDMAVRALFLGDQRVASSNWPMVDLNFAALDWVGNTAASYEELVSLAVDEAGGRAFTTEYAGTSALVNQNGIYSASWNAAAFAEIDPTLVVEQLDAQGLYECGFDDWGEGEEICQFTHPQVQALLEKYLPVPLGVDPMEFWGDLAMYADGIDLDAWMASPGFSADFEERIVIPGQHGIEMLDGSSQLTRLYTRISPHEMIEDPLFHETELGPVDNSYSATQISDCNGEVPDYLELDGGRTLALPNGVSASVPGAANARRISLAPATGPEQVQTDNAAAIDEAIEDFNREFLVGPQAGCSITSARAEAILALLAVFGIAGLQRTRRRSR